MHRYLASIEPLYKDYVLQRRADRKSYRDMGTFREWACEQLHAANFDVKVPHHLSELCLACVFLQSNHWDGVGAGR